MSSPERAGRAPNPDRAAPSTWNSSASPFAIGTMPNSVSRSGGVGGELTAIAVPKASARLPDWVAMRPFSNSAHLIATLANRDKVRLSFPSRAPLLCNDGSAGSPRRDKPQTGSQHVPRTHAGADHRGRPALRSDRDSRQICTRNRFTTMSSDRSARPPPR